MRLCRALVFAVILVGAAVYGPLDAWAQAKEPRLSVEFDKFLYRPFDKFVSSISIDNPGNEPLKEVRIVYSVFGHSAKDRFAEGKTIFRRTIAYRPRIPPGHADITFARRASEFGDSGAFPVRVELKLGRRVAATARTSLVVLPEASEPQDDLRLAVAWDLHEPAHFDASGRYVDTGLSRRSTELSQIIEASQRSPAMRFALSASPLLLFQLAEFRAASTESGYLKSGAPAPPTTAAAPASATADATPDAGAASPTTGLLAQLKLLSGSPKVEMLDAPMTHASLKEMGERNWNSDVFRQIEGGRRIIDATLGAAPPRRGFLAPEGEFHPEALADLAAKNVAYAIVSDLYFPGEGRPGLHSYQLVDTESNRIEALFALTRASQLMSRVSSRSTAQQVFGEVVDAYVKQRSRDRRLKDAPSPADGAGEGEGAGDDGSPYVAVIAPQATPGSTSPDALASLYDAFLKSGWIKPVTPEEALRSYASRQRSILYRGPTRSKIRVTADARRASHLKELSRARRELKSFLASAHGSEPMGDRLWRYVYLAEDTSWDSPGNNQRRSGKNYLRAVRRAVASQFSKVTFDARAVTLTGSRGKIPVEMRNDSPYTMELTLSASNPDVRFPDGATRRLRIKRGAELTAIPLEVATNSHERVRIALRGGETVIGEKFVTVTGPSSSFSLVWSGAILTLMVAGAILVALRLRRGRGRPKRLASG